MANNHHKCLYTALIFLGHFTYGTMSGINAAALVDFQYLLRGASGTFASIKEISFYMTFTMLGGILGSFVSFLYKVPLLTPYLNRQLFTSLLLLLFAASFGLVPRISTLPTFYTFCFLAGLGGGNWNTVSSTWLMELWSGRGLGSVLQGLQLCYGLGTIAGPFLVGPYLSGYLDDDGAQVHPHVIEERRSNLMYPYAIFGLVEALVGLLFLILYLPDTTRYRRRTTRSDYESKSLERPTRLLDTPSTHTYRSMFIVLIMALLATYNLAEVNHLHFQSTYFQSLPPPANISASDAAQISSITATTYTAGRGLSILTASCLSPGGLIAGHLGLGLVSFGALFWTQTASNSIYLSINSAFIGLAMSALMPAIFSYVNSYLLVDDRRNAVFFFALGLPSVFTPLLLGPYLESFPTILLYLDLGSLSVACLLFVIIVGLVRASQREKRYQALVPLLTQDETRYGSIF